MFKSNSQLSYLFVLSLFISLFSSGYAFVINSTIEAPLNETWTNSNNDTLQFQITPYGNETVDCELFLMNESVWIPSNVTTITSLNTTTILYANFSFVENYTSGWWFLVNCSNSTSGNYATSEVRVFYSDQTNASISFTSPFLFSGNYSRNYIDGNIVSVDNSGSIDTLTLTIYNSTDIVNTTYSSTSPICWLSS